MHSEQFQLHADIEQIHWWFVARRQILCRLAAEVLPPSKDTVVVDIGCGTGGNIAALAKDYRCIGIDTSVEGIELARRRFPQVQFLTGQAPADLQELASQARLFLLTDVLEHIQDDYAMFSSLLAASSPGTYFLVTVPADESLWSEHDESFGHYRRYDRARLEGVWAGLPVTTLLASYFNTRLLPIIKLIRAKNQWRGHSGGQAGTDFWLPIKPINQMLTAIFAGESKRLIACSRGKKQGYRAGASLIALLRRETGPIAIRTKPGNLPPDHR